jgi:tetratricopeptide (TPR) repeat protein
MSQVEGLSKTWVEASDKWRSAIAGLLDDPQHRVEADFMAAKVAMLTGEPTTAMLLLDEVIKNGKDDRYPGLHLSADIGALLWKGTVARHNGDFRTARAVYREIIRRRQEAREPGGGYLDIVSRMYLAEVASMGEQPTDEVVRVLTEAKSVWTPQEDRWKSVHRFYLKWLEYWLASIEMGPEAAQKTLSCGVDEGGDRLWIEVQHLNAVGIAGEPRLGFWGDDQRLLLRSLTMATENVASGIDRDLALFAIGYVRRNESEQATRHLERLYESDSFLAPDAGLGLAAVAKQHNKAKALAILERLVARFPGYKALAEECRKSL